MPLNPSTRRGPLAGVRVLDFTAIMLGPHLTRVLGDLGADVIKVEPAGGDVLRHAGPARSPGMGAPFLNLNRSKRSIVLDLAQPDAQAVVERLVVSADVLVHGLRPASARKLGLAYESVRALQPRLVYCAVHGYAQEGPYADRPAYDDLIQGAAGVAALSTATCGRPAYHPVPVADRTTALTAAYSVIAALFHRERTGEGQAIDVTMFEALAESTLTAHLGGHTFDPPPAPPGYGRLLAPERGPYRTRDGYVCVVCYTDDHWQRFFELAGREDLKQDPRYRGAQRAEHQAALNALMAAAMATDTTAGWLERLARAGIPAGPVHTLEALIDDPQVAATGLLHAVDHPTEGRLRGIGAPSRWSATPPDLSRPAPRLGEHTREVLREVGCGEDEIDALYAAGVAR